MEKATCRRSFLKMLGTLPAFFFISGHSGNSRARANGTASPARSGAGTVMAGEPVPVASPASPPPPAPVAYLLLAAPVAGFQYHQGPAVWHQMRAGDFLELRREPENPYDKRAIALYWPGPRSVPGRPGHDAGPARPDLSRRPDNPAPACVTIPAGRGYSGFTGPAAGACGHPDTRSGNPGNLRHPWCEAAANCRSGRSNSLSGGPGRKSRPWRGGLSGHSMEKSSLLDAPEGNPGCPGSNASSAHPAGGYSLPGVPERVPPCSPCGIPSGSGCKIGYLPRIHNHVIATLLDQSAPLHCRITAIHKEKPYWAKVDIEVCWLSFPENTDIIHWKSRSI